MSQYRVILLPQAVVNLDQILVYIAKDSVQNAMGMVDRIQRQINSLDRFPRRFEVHARRKDPAKSVHSMPVQPYIVYYRVDERSKVMRVLTIYHGKRRQPRRFK